MAFSFLPGTIPWYQSGLSVRSVPFNWKRMPVSAPPSPPEYARFSCVIWSVIH